MRMSPLTLYLVVNEITPSRRFQEETRVHLTEIGETLGRSWLNGPRLSGDRRGAGIGLVEIIVVAR